MSAFPAAIGQEYAQKAASHPFTYLNFSTIPSPMSEPPFDVTIQVGEIIRAEPFPETRKPKMCKLRIDLGARTVQSAAQLLYHYTAEELVGRQVLCATNLGTVNIAGYTSEALTVGIPGEDGHPVLVRPDKEVPLGGHLY